LVYTNPRMTQEAYARFYDLEYRPLYHGRDHPASDLFAMNYARGRLIADYLIPALRGVGRSLNGLRILDVGCGAGGAIAYLRDSHDCIVHGIDFGSEGIAFGSTHAGLSLSVGDLESAHLPWRPDVILYSHVFEHVLDLSRECRLISQTLAPGGLLYIEIPSVKNIRANYEWDFLRLLQNAHTYHFTLRTLTNVLRRHGFTLENGTEYVRSLFRFTGTANSSYDSDYEDVRRFLARTERLRFVGKHLSLPRRAVLGALDALGLKSRIKRILRR
jgi:2-polyprenyl-3-methyl-5-hydroxy-6-metoxy-1,4-benzoquinol methylase